MEKSIFKTRKGDITIDDNGNVLGLIEIGSHDGKKLRYASPNLIRITINGVSMTLEEFLESHQSLSAIVHEMNEIYTTTFNNLIKKNNELEMQLNDFKNKLDDLNTILKSDLKEYLKGGL